MHWPRLLLSYHGVCSASYVQINLSWLTNYAQPFVSKQVKRNALGKAKASSSWGEIRDGPAECQKAFDFISQLLVIQVSLSEGLKVTISHCVCGHIFMTRVNRHACAPGTVPGYNCHPWVIMNSTSFHSQMSLGLDNEVYGSFNYNRVGCLYV